MVENNKESSNKVVVVENPIEIPAIIYTLEEESKNIDLPSYTLLIHREQPCIVRGVNQAFSGEFIPSLGHHTYRGIPEIKRQDGGNSWYHGPTTCLVKTQPSNSNNSKKKLDNMKNWHKDLSEWYQKFSGDKLQHFQGRADLFSSKNSLEQMIGTSGYNGIVRACWYEQGFPITDLFNLVNGDSQVKDKCKFKDSLGLARWGFSRYLQNELSIFNGVPSSQFVSETSLEKALKLQQKPGRLIGPCIGGEYPSYREKDQNYNLRGD